MSSARGGEAEARLPRLVFLIGYRGTGKSTVAPLLAGRLGWDWADADAELERRSGAAVGDVIARLGEAAFRDREAAILDEWCRCARRVVATGGGVVLREDNRRRLRSSGRAVWLTADAATLWGRLQADPATAGRRPPLAGGGFAEVEESVRNREPLYRACADLEVSTVGRAPAEVAAVILDWLTGRENGTGAS